MSASKKFFPNLNGLRFIAAMTVAFSHLETFKSYLPLYFLKNRFVENSAQLSVTFFFVLSGFLIMWWFLEETGGEIQKINIKIFYLNRISRIWPLYFFIIFLSAIISFSNGSLFNDPTSIKRYILYIFWMPNLADLLYKPNVYLGQTWSLAVEEFFYLLFPILLIRIRAQSLTKSIVFILIAFLVISTILNPIFLHIFFPGIQIDSSVRYLITFFERYRMYSFLFGALVAILLFYKKFELPNISILRQKTVLFCCSMILLLLFFFGITFSFLTHHIYSFLFAVIIFMFCYTGYYSKILNSKLFALGGKISYSIYMLHMFVVMLLLNHDLVLIKNDNFWVSIMVSWILLFIFSMVVSYLSYKNFENPLRIWIRNYYLKNGEK